MLNSWINHLDFVFLVYGLSFLVFVPIVFAMARMREDGMSWHWLGWFGLLHGLYEWGRLIVLVHGSIIPIVVIDDILLIASCVCLFEFGRRNMKWSSGRKVPAWIYLPIAVVMGLGWQAGLSDFVCITRYGMIYFGGFLTAAALWQWGGRTGYGRRAPRYYVVVAAFIGYAVLSGLVAGEDRCAAAILNEDVFLRFFGLPIQVVRCLLAVIITIALWREHVIWRKARLADGDGGLRLKWEGMAVGIIAVIMIIGWFGGKLYETKCQAKHEALLLNSGRLITMSIDTDIVNELIAGLDRPAPVVRAGLVEHCAAICDSADDVRNLYLVTIKEGKVRFLVDSEPDKCRGGTAALAYYGQEYLGAPPQIVRVFQSGQPVVTEPWSDKAGAFISVFFPVRDRVTGRILAVLGVDADTASLINDVRQERLAPYLVSAMVVLLFLTLLMFWRRTLTESQLKEVESRRLQAQQATLLTISRTLKSAGSDAAPDYRDILKQAGEALRVDRAEVWTCRPDQGNFEISGSYSVSGKVWEVGGIVEYEAGHDAQSVAEDRLVWSVDDCSNESRHPSLMAWFDAQGVRAVVMAPFHVSGKMGGMMVFCRLGSLHHWRESEVRFVAEVAGYISMMLANIQRDRAEKALRQVNKELETRVQERTTELSRKNAELYHEMMERLKGEEERRKLELQVQQAQKFESLGLMAGGIAHDFNNILMTIRGNAELARMESPAGSAIQDYLNDIDTAAARASSLSRQMLAFSGRGHVVVQGVDLNIQVQDMTQILEASVGKKATIQYDFQSPLPPVDGDPSQIGQIVMNLAINAAEAIGDKPGTIIVRTGTLWYDPARSEHLMWMEESLSRGQYVFVEVTDTGCGMDEITRKRIFDPFFTTKFTGRGLGLATVMGIVKGHRGAIEVKSQVGVGTTIRVVFPEGHRAATVKGAPIAKTASRMGVGTILVVDDEETVRLLSKRMLERLGFKVLLASDGVEAMDVFRERRQDINCVLLDMTMPRKDGQETFQELRAIDPNLKIVICSGFSEEDVVARFGKWKLSGFLQKPYAMDRLAACIKAALSS